MYVDAIENRVAIILNPIKQPIIITYLHKLRIQQTQILKLTASTQSQFLEQIETIVFPLHLN